ncbi:hypothetical protein HN748_01200 [Candidatus Peregrinibacteria bacterium]|jgi:hypothetical protein|nr:hypothetical protein [Candidatus Peregrinibacteria bacterium]MBT7702827.1 hypothetical protein [Candidatus Peregrinibacteria bacterium]
MNAFAKGVLSATLAFSGPAAAQEATVPATVDLSGIETVLPAETEDNGAIRGALTLAATRVSGLGFEVTLAADPQGDDSIRFIGVPHDQFKAVTDAVNETHLGAVGCVGFVVVPDTDKSPAEYDGTWEMGATCRPGLPLG